jgi:hypothetical protein
MGCPWRNTTNSTAGFCAQVAPYQHSLAWNTANPLEVFAGNDSGLWRSTDQIGESGPACGLTGNTDAVHFRNLNGSLGSLAEVASMSQAVDSPYTMMAGLGYNGTAGVKGSSMPPADWPQILDGLGGPVAIDPGNSSNWYANAQDGVSIYLCAQLEQCSPADFGSSPVIDMNAKFEDGYAMNTPAPFLVDPLDTSQLLIGTCRVWRVPGGGVGWNATEAISPIFDTGAVDTTCAGDSPIRSMAAMALPDGSEIVYIGTYGQAEGGFSPFGQVWSAIIQPGATAMPAWTDLTWLNIPTNDTFVVNANGLDISSVFIDSHDPTGQTVYATVEGFPSQLEPVPVRLVYRSADGGTTWTNMTANLPFAPVSSLVVDPQDANTVYIATDVGVYFATKIKSCVSATSACWSVFGTGLPAAPVVALNASNSTAPEQVLIAGTYGRGIWQTPLWTAGTSLTTATADPDALTFPSQTFGTDSSVQTVKLDNTGALALTPTLITMSGDFSETDNCQQATVPVGGSCVMHVTFRPAGTGSRPGEMTIGANVYGGQLTVALSGTGTPAGAVSLTPATVDFGQVELGATSLELPVSASNNSQTAVPISGVTVTSPFTIAKNTCSATLAAGNACLVDIEFTPVQRGAVAGTLTFTDGAGVQTVALTGTGAAVPTDIMATTPLAFGATVTGHLSAVQTVLLANTGDLPLTAISVSATGPFQSSNTCGTQLGGVASCQINVIFAPLTTGVQTGTLTVSDALRTQTVALSGTGVLPAALNVNPMSLTFAKQTPGVASAPLLLTIGNTGGAPAASLGFQITGTNAGSFTTGITTCGTSLNNGGTCTVQVIFDPATTGGSAATLKISYLAPAAEVVNVPLSGTAQASSGLNVNPAVLTFPAENPGQPSVAQPVTISNSSTFPALSLVLSATPPFSLTGSTCPASLAASASCSVGVVFTPAVSGPVTGALTVSSTSIATPATVVLNGTGTVPAAIQVTPAIINFAATAETGVGTASSPVTVTLSNPGTAASLNNLAIQVPVGFQLVNNTCAATLGPGTSCTAGVEFAPLSAGAQSGSLGITSSSAASSAQVALDGIGFDFTVKANGLTTQSVTGGQTANYSLTLQPLNGSQGTFTFECATLPENATCTFNPVTETLSAGAEGNITVAVSTGTSGTSARLRQPVLWRVLPLACGLLLLPLALWKRRKILLMVVLLAFMASGVSSCSSSGGGTGGGSSGKGTYTTPVGTYPIPVTVMSTGVSHTLTVTLTVD